MVKAVKQSVSGVDAQPFGYGGRRGRFPRGRRTDRPLSVAGDPAVLAINKIDLLREKSVLMEEIAAFRRCFDFSAVVPVSARTHAGMERLVEELAGLAAPGMHFLTTMC